MRATFAVDGVELAAEDLPAVGGVRAVRVVEPTGAAEYAVLLVEPDFALCPCRVARTGVRCPHIAAALRFTAAVGRVTAGR